MKNIVKEWITSIFGIVLMALACVDFFLDKELGYNIALLIVGLILLRMKDEWVGKFFNAFVKKFLGVFLLLAIFTSCVTQEKCYQRYPPEVSTKTEKEIIIERHDSIVMTPPDSSRIKALIICDSLGNAHINTIVELEAGLKVKPRIKLVDNYLMAECIVDSMAIYLTWNSRFEKETKIEKLEPKPIISKKKSWWRNLMEKFRSFFEVSGYILWIGLILLGVKKFVFKI